MIRELSDEEMMRIDNIDSKETGAEIYKIETMSDGIRNNGYKSIYNAIAEIVDNSIESSAKNVLIIGKEDLKMNKQRIVSYAFLDDGEGMENDVLRQCLQIGFSSRRDRKGMGRFGVGLPQASLFASPKVEVYSWRNGYENCKCVYIDLEKVSKGEQKTIIGPFSASIPEDYKKYLDFNINSKRYYFKDHGTFVIWPKVDREDPKKWNTFKRKMSFDLGRKYRWMLNDSSVEISTIKLGDFESFAKVLPNDPLFLMQKSMHCVQNNCNETNDKCEPYSEELGFTESLFEPYTTEDNLDGVVNFPVKYENKNGNICDSTITLRFSIVKEKYYDKNYISRDPGALSYGKIAKQNMGISIVRQNREIDFGEFGFFSSINQPNHRWWGCEISFTSELDEAFGISNNKQQVDLRPIDEDSYDDYDEVRPMWLQLKVIITDTINDMVKINKNRRASTRTLNTNSTINTSIGEHIKGVESNNPDLIVGKTSEPIITSEVTNEIKEELVKEGIITDNDEITMQQQKQYLESNTRCVYLNLGPRAAFIDYEDKLNVLKIIINKDHKFYTDYVVNTFTSEKMQNNFEIFVASLIKSIQKLNLTHRDVMDKLLDELNRRLKFFME